MSLFKQTAAVMALAAPLAAYATTPSNTIEFGFTRLFDQVSVAPTFVSGDLGVTVRGYNSSNQQKDVSIGLKGIGVTSGFLEAGEINSSLFNSPGEYITLTFNKEVQLTKLTFALWEDGFDKAILSWNGRSMELFKGNTGILFDTFSLSGVTGTTFKIQATGAFSSFRLEGLSAVAAIPEPSTYALMGLGLVGIAAAARRQRRGA